MTAARPEGQASEGIRSLEVRWIFAGQLAPAVTEWFGRFPAKIRTLDDVYLMDPDLPGMSVKVREGRALEVKVYRGSPGLIQVAGRVCGRLQSWRKWSFPCDPASQGIGDPSGWRQVSKRRRICWFAPSGGSARGRVPGPGGQPGCAVELTEVRTGGEAWWTLGFEATGPGSLRRRELEATAALIFGRALPDGVELRMNDSMSYAQWLQRGAAASNSAEA
jgi:hypothetical protein